jgi:hypothetical protein
MNDIVNLDIDAVEMILGSCVKGASLVDLMYLVGIPYNSLKVQLFYLVEYNMISYLGQKQAFFLKREGAKLLSVIDETKYLANLSDDEYITTITLE